MSTASVPIRFRCFRCQKLLGVSKSKAGAVVSCPQCSAELIVPESVETTEPLTTPSSKSSSSSRIEPVVVPWDAPPEPESSASPSDVAFPAIQIEPISLRAETTTRPRSPKPMPPVEPQVVVEAAPMIEPPPRSNPPPESPNLTLSVEAPSLRETGQARPATTSLARGVSRFDVVLPRSVLTLWSFLVLLGMVFAFTAGLLIGRFLWARGIPVAVPAGRSISQRSDGNSPIPSRQPDCNLLTLKV